VGLYTDNLLYHNTYSINIYICVIGKVKGSPYITYILKVSRPFLFAIINEDDPAENLDQFVSGFLFMCIICGIGRFLYNIYFRDQISQDMRKRMQTRNAEVIFSINGFL